MKISVNAVWDGGVTGKGRLKAEYLDTNIAIPASLGGSGNGANPKEILVASVTTCYTATLTFVLESRKLPVAELTVNSEANISDNEFKITHYANIVLSADATEEQIQSAQRATEAADKGCDVGNLLKKADVIIEVQGKVTSK
ncbi:OsmC family protein [Neobacillus terrae]|uniref:OsmC family protein n=1 Tax=Neobacillus terrae TaxID=3034837 RepID=UPI001FB11547|nr:OsmC family protein [Neobacillus terrae]